MQEKLNPKTCYTSMPETEEEYRYAHPSVVKKKRRKNTAQKNKSGFRFVVYSSKDETEEEKEATRIVEKPVMTLDEFWEKFKMAHHIWDGSSI